MPDYRHPPFDTDDPVPIDLRYLPSPTASWVEIETRLEVNYGLAQRRFAAIGAVEKANHTCAMWRSMKPICWS